MNKELAQLINKQSFKEVDSRTFTPQLQHAFATRWVLAQRPTNNGSVEKESHNSSTTLTLKHSQLLHLRWQCEYYLLLTIAILKQFTVFTTDVARVFLNIPSKMKSWDNLPKSTATTIHG
eukprot:2058638-Amphidinium_carterae.1